MRNIVETPCVICKQKTAGKTIPTFDDFVTANINGFGDAIGSITNKITTMITKQIEFEEGTPEFEELSYRIICGQTLQQNAIDQAKGIESNPMAKEWYDFKANILEKDDEGNITKLDDFNISILADKKPYFFIYNYPSLKKEYNSYVNKLNTKSTILFGLGFDELVALDEKTESIIDFLKKAEFHNPVNSSPSVMNKICWHVEKELKDIKIQSSDVFDTAILKTNKEYRVSDYKKVEKIYQEYKVETTAFAKAQLKKTKDDSGFIVDREYFENKFKSELSKLKIDGEDLANIMVDLCYKSNNSKQFAWDMVGENIIENLLSKNCNLVSFPVKDDSGEIEFNGDNFTIKQIKVGEEFCE